MQYHRCNNQIKRHLNICCLSSWWQNFVLAAFSLKLCPAVDLCGDAALCPELQVPFPVVGGELSMHERLHFKWCLQLNALECAAGCQVSECCWTIGGPVGRFWAGCIGSDIQELSAFAVALACPWMSQFTAWLTFSACKAEVIVCIWAYFPTLPESTCIGESHVIKRWDEKRISSLESYKTPEDNFYLYALLTQSKPLQLYL